MKAKHSSMIEQPESVVGTCWCAVINYAAEIQRHYGEEWQTCREVQIQRALQGKLHPLMLDDILADKVRNQDKVGSTITCDMRT